MHPAVQQRPASGRPQAAFSRFFRSLFGQVLVALVLGTALGLLFPEFAAKLKPLGDAFIKLIKMLIGPIAFCVVVAGICGAGELKKVGRVGIKAVLYFEVVTTIALALGIALAYIFHPGTGMNVNPASLDASAMSAYVETAEKVKSAGMVDFLLKLIPSTVKGAFASGDVLQVLLPRRVAKRVEGARARRERGGGGRARVRDVHLVAHALRRRGDVAARHPNVARHLGQRRGVGRRPRRAAGGPSSRG